MRSQQGILDRAEMGHPDALPALAKELLYKLGKTGPGLVGDKVLVTVSTDLGAAQNLEIATILGSDRRGKLTIQIDDAITQVDVAKARVISEMLTSAIEAAISDELVYLFLREDIGLDDAKALQGVAGFRVRRQGSASTVHPH